MLLDSVPEPLDPALPGEAVYALAASEDTPYGGLGGAPKFPPSAVLEFLIRHAAFTPPAVDAGTPALARDLAPVTRADGAQVGQAAELAKADLSSEMVYEFPELQGLMGRYYAEAAGLPQEVANACEEHYSPLGPSDDVPTAPVSVAVALADKLDTLTGFWAIDEKPTGSKDPYALRRAALGVIRLVLENDVRMPLDRFFDSQLLRARCRPLAVWVLRVVLAAQ